MRDDQVVRTRLQTAPAFVQFLVTGLLGGLIAGVMQKLWEHVSWAHALVSGLFPGLVLAVVDTFTTRRRRSEIDAITAGLTPAQQVQAFRTSPRGPVPSNAEVREAAIRLAEYRLAEYERHRVGGRWAGGFVGAVFVALAITTSPFCWLAVGLIVCAFAQELAEPRRLRRRIEQLRTSPAGQAAIV